MLVLFTLTCLLTVSIHIAAAQDLGRLGNRAAEAAYVLDEIMGMPEGTIPDSLFKDSRCIAVIPGVVKEKLGSKDGALTQARVILDP